MIIGIAVAVLAVELVLVWDQLAKAWKSLYSAKWWWVLAAVGAALASMHCFGQMQRKLLRSAALIMSALLIGSAVVTATSIPAGDLRAGGPADGRALAERAQRLQAAHARDA